MLPSAKKPEPDWALDVGSPEESERLAAGLARRLRGGEVVLLRGGLGAGKTFFVSALARALGVTRPVSSPTYVIHQAYPAEGGLTLNHCDFYRFEREADLETLDVEEHVGPDAVMVVEWPERAPGAFEAVTLELKLTPTGEKSRRIEGWWGELEFDPAGWPFEPKFAKKEASDS